MSASAAASSVRVWPRHPHPPRLTLEELTLRVATLFFRYTSSLISQPILLLLQTLANALPRDLLFAVGVVRAVYQAAWVERCTELVKRRLFSKRVVHRTFEEYHCHLPTDLKELMLEAATQARGWQQPKAPTLNCEHELPAVERILLLGPGTNAKHGAAVAGSLACEIDCPLLVVDAALLEDLSSCVKGGWSSKEAPSLARGQKARDASTKSSLEKLLQSCELASQRDMEGSDPLQHAISTFLAGGRIVFEVNALRKAIERISGPCVIYMPNVDQSICANRGIAHAFEQAFKGCQATFIGHYASTDRIPRQPADDADLDQNLLQIALGSQLFQRPDVPPGDGSDSADLAAERYELLRSVFPTHLKLQPPVGTKQRLLWKNQLKEERQQRNSAMNFRMLHNLSQSRGVVCPECSSDIYRGEELSEAEWTKVLAWSMRREFSRRTKEEQDRADVERMVRMREETKEAILNRSSLVGPYESGREGWPDLQVANPSSPASAVPEYPFAKSRKHVLQRALRSWFPCTMRALNRLAVAYGRALIEKQDAALGPGCDIGLELYNIQDDVVSCTSRRDVILNEEDIRYGMNMLSRCDNGTQQCILPGNSFERTLLRQVIRPEDVTTSLSDVGALKEAKAALREAVHLPLLFPDVFSRGGLARACKGVLLFGPPGTGKSLLARATAAECGACFLSLEPSSVVSKWHGDSVRYVKAAFALAKKLAPTVIFIDEVDALLGARSANEHEALRELKNELMAHWDGVRSGGESNDDRIMVLGATNRPQDLDEAVLRRFSRRVLCDLPDAKGREDILSVLLVEERLVAGFDVSDLSKELEGYSGSDLRNLCTAAALVPLREVLKENDGSVPHSLVERYRQSKLGADGEQLLRPLSMDDFRAAKNVVSPSVGEDTFHMDELRRWNEQYGDYGRGTGRRTKLSYYL
mmetsp:Transcript_8705/g.32107  ORF Transcript_8705/g.32107 Transcript_8705/m.32107 type:complete len:929 (-) Transcript_8705:2384-5170(-)